MSRTGLIDLIGEDDGSSSRYDLYLNPALGGGEEVRVCNPVRFALLQHHPWMHANNTLSVCLILT